MTRGKLGKPRIFTKLHKWGELNINHGFPRWARMAEMKVFAARMGRSASAPGGYGVMK